MYERTKATLWMSPLRPSGRYEFELLKSEDLSKAKEPKRLLWVSILDSDLGLALFVTADALPCLFSLRGEKNPTEGTFSHSVWTKPEGAECWISIGRVGDGWDSVALFSVPYQQFTALLTERRVAVADVKIEME